MTLRRRLLVGIAVVLGLGVVAGAVILPLTAPATPQRVLAVASAPAEKYGEDFWTYVMRESATDGSGITVVGYAPDEVAATLLVACLEFTGHDAHTIGNGGFAWPRPTAADSARFDADLLHCRIAHPFDG